jgi:outer membrane receptor protein involved in Fe transport
METYDLLHRIVLHLPILTTLCSVAFSIHLFSRYRRKGGGLHLLWWGIGMVTYGIGTFTEAWTTLFGWHPAVFRAWYVAGAFLGGYPLAQGSIYLLMTRRFAHLSAIVVSSAIAVAGVLVFLTPLDLSLAEPHRLSGEVIGWQELRLISPFINLYSVLFLVGGAIVSALRFRRAPALRHRYVGNIFIAVGAILPGIGGAMTRAGYVEALYLTELVGLTLIWVGYRLSIGAGPEPSVRRTATAAGRAVTAALLVGLLSTGAPVHAQGEPAEDDAQQSEEDGSEDATTGEEERASFFAATTVTATGREVDTLETATPVTVIGRDTIDRRTPENAADLLRSEPGVDVNGVGPNQSRPIIRGQRGLRVLFLADGLRMNNPRRQTDFGEVPGLVDIDSVESVEVVRGPASVLYGSDAIGGVLNLITRRPSGSGWAGTADLRYSTAGEAAAVHAGAQVRRDRYAVRLDASRRDSDDYEAPSGTYGDIELDDSVVVRDTGLQDDSIAGTVEWYLSPAQEVTLQARRYRADETGFGFVHPQELDSADPTLVRILYPFQDFDRFVLGYRHGALGSGPADSFEARLYRQDNERELVNDIDIDTPPPGPGAPGVLVEIDTLNFTDLTTTGLRLEASKALADTLLTYGAEGYEDDSVNTDLSSTVVSLTFPGPPFVVPIAEETDEVANAPNAENSSWGVFAQGEIRAGERVSVTAGARYQRVETTARPTAGWDISGLDFEDDQTVGALSVLYQATEQLRLFASYGTAFRAPNIIERLFNGLTPEGIGFQVLSPDLVSETSENFDLGMKYRRRNAILELTFFRNDIDDGIVQHFLSAAEIEQLPQETQDQIDALDPDLFVVQQRNADRLRYEGVELAVGWRAPRAWALGANYTHLEADRLDSLNPPTGDTFGDKINAYARWEPSERPLWVEYRIRHNADDQANLQPDEPTPPVGSELPGFTVHSIAGGWRFLERGGLSHELLLAVENLTDELYAEFSNATFFRPQAERHVKVGYRLRY